MTANLSDAQKQFFVDLAETSLNDLCNIQQSTTTTQDSLAVVHHNRVTVEDVPCGISFSSLTYKNEVGQSVVLTVDAVLRLKKSQVLSVNDLVVCRGKSFSVDGVYEGLTLKIVGLKYAETSE